MKKALCKYLFNSVFLFVGVFFLVSCLNELQAQHSFSEVYNRYLNGELTAIETVELQIEALSHSHSHDDGNFIKCLTPFFILLNQEKENIDGAILQKFNALSPTRSSTTTEYISPSGKFRIHYETVGSDRVPFDDFNDNFIPDYVEEVAEAADSSYRHQVITLGFPDPIGEGEIYDVFIKDLFSRKSYGFVSFLRTGSWPCNNSGPETCIYIENDFAGYPANADPEGSAIGALKVTMAHEFKHAIQYVQNGWSGETRSWMEMDATLMEEVVYDNVNDYYNYIEGFSTDLFQKASSSLIPGRYEDVTWALYFHEKFGSTFWLDVWDFIETDNSILFLTAVEQALQNRDESYPKNVLESYMWHFASGDQFSATNFGFEEHLDYPGPGLSAIYLEPLSALTSEFSLDRMSARYYSVEPIDLLEGYLSLNFINSSKDVQFGLIGYQKNGEVLTNKIVEQGVDQLTSINTDWQWSELDKVGLVAVNSSSTDENSFRFQVFERTVSSTEPNIKLLNTTATVNSSFRLYLPTTQNITLDIYDVLGRHIQTIHNGPVNSGFREFNFNTSNLASGIYLYRLISESGVQAFTFPVIK